MIIETGRFHPHNLSHLFGCLLFNGQQFKNPKPERIRPPATVPLPPMMAELPFEVLDVFDDDREYLTTLDHGEHKEDMD